MKDYLKRTALVTLLAFLIGIALQTCAVAAEEECKNYQVRCNITRKCVPLSWKCDGDHDCGEGDVSDEENCPPKTCADEEARCLDGTCIPERWTCDGEEDCSAGEDENNCTVPASTCDEHHFTCVEDGQCIIIDWKCDGSHDCDDGSDEKGCEPRLSDCGPEQFKCNTTDMCISTHWVCDGDADCEDGSDEGNHLSGFVCNKTCKDDEFRCGDQTKCVDNSWRCDGDFDCIDHSDEADCQGTSTEHCNPNTEFTCVSNGDCIHLSWKCDGGIDCEDGSDEGSDCVYECSEGQFKCHNNFCISDKLVCDHSKDCMDGSDEWNCTKPACKDVGEFDCYGDGSQCIPDSQVCDGRNDCQHREDEDPALCKMHNPCEKMQCGDHAHCERQVQSAVCVCDSGFIWHDEEGTCKDIDECQERGVCSQICINRKGGYKCECKPGYVLENHYFCRAEGEQAWLYYANRRDIRRIRADSHYMEIVVEETENCIALDIDYNAKLLFWTDRGAEEIKRGIIGDNMVTEIKTVIKNDGVGAFATDGLAVDWLYEHIYWTGTGSDTIKVSGYSGNLVKTLINTGLDEPRAICVDPENGFMYWSDWGQEPKIERSGMDGSSRVVLVHEGHGLEWPNGLTVDYVGRRIYWIDAKLHRIGTAKLDGSDISHVLVDATEIVQPFSISVFEDSLYWTDWHTNTIKSVNKLTGHKPKTISVGSLSVMDIKVYHEQKQENGFKQNATSLCAAAQCAEFCLPTPHMNTAQPKAVVCACSDSKALLADQKSCMAQATTKAPMSTTAKKTEISTKQPQTTHVPVETTEGGYTVMPGNKIETVPHPKLESKKVGIVAIIAASIVAIIVIVAFIVGCFVYRSYKAKNKKSMNFDNPVYRKTTTTEEQCMISHEDEQQPTVTVYKDHA